MEKTEHVEPPKDVTSEELEEIRARDAGFTDVDNCAPAVQDRRRLLNALDSALATFTEVRQSHQLLVKELDWMLSGAQAAPQASLCDIVAMVRGIKLGKFKFCQYGYAHPEGAECVGQCLRGTEHDKDTGNQRSQ